MSAAEPRVGVVDVWTLRTTGTDDPAAVARERLPGILGAWLGRPAAAVRVERRAGGRPWLADGGDLRFSVSHAPGLAVVAVTRGRAVGVDAEAVDPHRLDLAVAARFLGPAVAARLEALPNDERVEAFLDAWTRREATAKGLGVGLDHAPDDGVPGGRTVRLDVGPGHVASLWAGGDAPVAVRRRELPTGYDRTP